MKTIAKPGEFVEVVNHPFLSSACPGRCYRVKEVHTIQTEFETSVHYAFPGLPGTTPADCCTRIEHGQT